MFFMKNFSVLSTAIKCGILTFFLVSNNPVLSQPKTQSVKDTWIYSMKYKSIDTTLTKSQNLIYLDVTFVCSNKKDSIKIIQAVNASNVKNTNLWYFQKGNIKICDKFGLIKTSHFEEFEITAKPDSSLKTESGFLK